MIDHCLYDFQGEFSGVFAMLLDEDTPFPAPFLSDATVDSASVAGNELLPDLCHTRMLCRDGESETLTQPLDYSLGTRSQHGYTVPEPSLDDLPELKLCPLAAAENGLDLSTIHETPPVITSTTDMDIPVKKDRKTIKRKLPHSTDDQNHDSHTLSGAKIPKIKVEFPDDHFVNDMSRDPNSQSYSYLNDPTTGSEGDHENDSKDSLTSPSVPRRPGRKPGQPSKVYHLWEFLRDLLLNEDYCPSHVDWIDRPKGVFRIARSEDVAQLWGQKKRTKRKMTYEKMSRAIRFSRAAGYFGSLPKNGDYPKKLCFKFGPRATDWIGPMEKLDNLDTPVEKAPASVPVGPETPTVVTQQDYRTVHWRKRKCHELS